MAIALSVVVLVVVFGGAYLLTKRNTAHRLGEDWTGVVLKKWISTYNDQIAGRVVKTPKIRVKIDGGHKEKLSVSAATYNSLAEGDRIAKHAGQPDPIKA